MDPEQKKTFFLPESMPMEDGKAYTPMTSGGIWLSEAMIWFSGKSDGHELDTTGSCE